MANGLDPKRANIALGLAVARWKKLPDDSIEASLDNPSEWLQEAALMNHFLPPRLFKVGYSFIAVVPNEFAVGIETVRQYAGLIYKHMVPMETLVELAELSAAEIADQEAFHESARQQSAISRDELVLRSSRFFAVPSDPLAGGED